MADARPSFSSDAEATRFVSKAYCEAMATAVERIGPALIENDAISEEALQAGTMKAHVYALAGCIAATGCDRPTRERLVLALADQIRAQLPDRENADG